MKNFFSFYSFYFVSLRFFFFLYLFSFVFFFSHCFCLFFEFRVCFGVTFLTVFFSYYLFLCVSQVHRYPKTWTVSSYKGCSHLTDITGPWGWEGQNVHIGFEILPYFDFVVDGHPCFINTCPFKSKGLSSLPLFAFFCPSLMINVTNVFASYYPTVCY